jgi:hypothetical protein
MVSIGSEHSLLKMSTKTWARDSHGLFDYEATSTKNSQLFTNCKVKFIRKKNDVKLVQENYEPEMDERELAKVKVIDSKSLI